MEKSRTYIAIPPGATIKEQIEDRGMKQKELAARLGCSEKHLSRLINGEVQLSQDMALRLEMVLGVPAHFWNNLESIYREKLQKVKEENDLDDDIQISKSFPYAQMSTFGWVPKTRNSSERVIELRKFFEVAQLNLLERNNLLPLVACRRMSEGEKADYALIAWSQRAKLEARGRAVDEIDLSLLRSSLGEIRSFSRLSAEEFRDKLVDCLARCGVCLVFLPHLKGSYLHGASFYDGSKVVVGMTARGKNADVFWFSLFHELAHILLGHIGQSGGTSEEDERAADLFARNQLIPPEEYAAFVEAGNYSAAHIVGFASLINIDPGIVLGRLQKDNYVSYSSHTQLKKHYVIE